MVSLKDLYVNSVHKHNKIVDDYLTAITKNETNMEQYCFNAGFDLFCPEDTESIGAQKVVLDHKIISCMKMKNIYVSYYLYSRSSTPMKTPLRLANSVGVIDSGYRGHIKAVFDNKNDYDFMEFNIEFGSRLAQLCPPNLEYPMKIIIVDNFSKGVFLDFSIESKIFSTDLSPNLSKTINLFFSKKYKSEIFFNKPF